MISVSLNVAKEAQRERRVGAWWAVVGSWNDGINNKK